MEEELKYGGLEGHFLFDFSSSSRSKLCGALALLLGSQSCFTGKIFYVFSGQYSKILVIQKCQKVPENSS